ncbi:MAG: hypothetical protein DRI54_07905 [Bacteroidetes bacterium]|nr:MAG: hypothetical protein DRI54_07905 [Bacteroidota bacterium]
MRISYWDSLATRASSIELKKTEAAALNNVGYIYKHQGNIPKAIEFYRKSLKIQDEIGDKYGMAHSLNNVGRIYENQGDISNALAYYHESLSLMEDIGDKKGMAYPLNNIGEIYKNQGNIPKALEYFHKSLKIQEDIGDNHGIAAGLNNIALVYNQQGDIPKALDYHNKSLKIFKDIGYKANIGISLNNIGIIYESKGDLLKALDYFNQSLKIHEEIGDKQGVASSMNLIGSVYKKLADKSDAQGRDTLLSKSLTYFNQSLQIREAMGNKEGTAYTLNYIGVIMFNMGKIHEAQKFAQQSLTISQKIGFPVRIKDAAKLLSQIYEKQNKGMQALEMHQLYITMRDSIYNQETQKATAQQQAKYEYEKQKVIDDAENDKLLAIEKEEKEKQQIITATTAGGLGLVMVFLFFVYNRLKVTRKQKTVIEEQKEKVEKQRDVIEHTHKEITDSIEYAKRIQGAILPPARIVKEYLEDSFIFYLPKDVVAGDFYWMRHQDDKILFAAADCTGHGVPGAMVSVVCNMALNRSVREYGITDPGALLDKTREIIVREFEKSEEEVKDGMDIALCTLEGNKLQYAGAYNPLWIIRNGKLLETKANRWPIGLSRDPQPYTTHSIDLEKGDVIYIFTDGLVDQFGGEKGKKLKVTGFKKLLLGMHDKPMETQRKLIADAFYDWKGDLEQVDDICLIGVRV